MKKRYSIIAVLAALLLVFCSCGKKSEAYDYASEEAYYADDSFEAYPQEEVAGGSFIELDTSSAAFNTSNLKLIYTATMSMETEHYNDDVEALRNLTAVNGGYISNESVSGTEPKNSGDSGRRASMTVRIPSENYYAFTEALKGIGTSSSFSQNVEDVTDTYYDIETRLEVLEITKERIEALLKEATDMTSIIELNNELSDITYEIESYKGSKKNLDNRISYSTVMISVREVYKITLATQPEKTLGDKVKDTFDETLVATRDFFENLLLFLIAASPVIIIVAIAAVIITLCVKASRKKAKARLMARMAEEKATNEVAETTEAAEAVKADTDKE